MRKKIGIFGGTFNPIHNGHLDIAKGAYVRYSLDRIYFVPTGFSYHKVQDKIISDSDRINMLRLAIKNEEKFLIGEFDLKREGPTYSLDTVTDIKKIEGEGDYYFILGSDAFLKILQWKNIETLAENVFFLVAIRNEQRKVNFLESYFKMPEFIKNKTLIYDCDSTEISSEEIRKGNYDKAKLPEEVYDYIKDKGLYL